MPGDRRRDLKKRRLSHDESRRNRTVFCRFAHDSGFVPNPPQRTISILTTLNCLIAATKITATARLWVKRKTGGRPSPARCNDCGSNPTRTRTWNNRIKICCVTITLSGCVPRSLELTRSSAKRKLDAHEFAANRLLCIAVPETVERGSVVPKLHIHFAELQPDFVQRSHAEVSTGQQFIRRA